MTFADEAPVLSIAQPYATLCFTETSCRTCQNKGWVIGGTPYDPEQEQCPDCPNPIVKWIMTQPKRWPSIVGQRIWIASTAKRPLHCMTLGDWSLTNDGDGVTRGCRAPLYDLGRWWDFPLGCVIGSVRVTECLPIVSYNTAAWAQAAVSHENMIQNNVGNAFLPEHAQILGIARSWQDGRSWVHDPLVDITDQLPYADFTPGRYGYLLTEPELLPEPVPFRGGAGITKRWRPT